MSTNIEETDGARLAAHGPQTPTQRFTVAYFTEMQHKIENGGFTKGLGEKFYAPSMNFYNNNGAVLRGRDTTTSVASSLWIPFNSLGHEIDYLLAVPHGTDKKIVCVFGTRILKLKEPNGAGDVRVPFAVRFILGPEAEEGQGLEGLQWHEIRLHWDTGVLAKYMAPTEKVFQIK